MLSKAVLIPKQSSSHSCHIIAKALPVVPQQRCNFGMKFDFNNGDRKNNGKDKDDSQKKLPDPRSYFAKLYDMVWQSYARRVLLSRFQSNATYRFRNFFGLQ